MQTSESIKKVVKQRYGAIAETTKASGCGCSQPASTTQFGAEYSKLEGYDPDADLGLGCDRYQCSRLWDTIMAAFATGPKEFITFLEFYNYLK